MRLRLGILVAGLAALAVAAEVPRKSPELDIQLANGKRLLLSQYKGRVVALAFIVST